MGGKVNIIPADLSIEAERIKVFRQVQDFMR